MYAFFGGGILNEKQNEKMPAGKEKKPVKKTAVIIIAAVLIVLAAVIGVFGYKYRSHIHAAYIFLTSSEDDIKENIDAAKKEQTDALVNSGFVNASKDLNDALEKGLITPEEHTSILMGDTTLDEVLARNNAENGDNIEDNVQPPPIEENGEDKADEQIPSEENTNTVDENKGETKPETGNKPVKNETQNGVTNNTQQNKPQTNTQTNTPANTQTPGNAGTPTSDVDKRIAELVTKMYVLKTEYTGAVEGVVASMKAEYSKLPAEQRTKSAKVSIAESYMGQINAMEAQCDAQVNAVVTELRKLLKENGRDMALADAIVSSYATEKDNTKAYYLSTYGD